MSGKMVVHESEHVAHLRLQHRNHAAPSVELGTSVHLQPRVVDDRPVGTHPAQVGEIGRRLLTQLEQPFPWNPSSIAERQGHAMALEQGQGPLAYPGSLTEFHCEPKIGWQRRQKGGEGIDLRGREIRAALNQNGSEPRPQLAHAIGEGVQHIDRIHEAALMRDLLGELAGEGELRRCAGSPAAHRTHRRDRVERGVDLHGVEGAREGAEKINWTRPVWIERPHPRRIIPSLRSQPQPCAHALAAGQGNGRAVIDRSRRTRVHDR